MLRPHRPRRLRRTPALCRLVAETTVEPRHSMDSLRKVAMAAVTAGVGGLMLFGVPRPDDKDAAGSQASDADGILNRGLREKGWQASDNTIAAIMAENNWVAGKVKHQRSTTRQRKRSAAPELVRRQFVTVAQDVLWCGDVTEIPTWRGSCIWPRSTTGSRADCSVMSPAFTMMSNWLVLH